MPSKKIRRNLTDLPIWFQPGAARGSAIRYLAAIIPNFKWIGLYEQVGKKRVLGPSIGILTEKFKDHSQADDPLVYISDVFDRKGNRLGQIAALGKSPGTIGQQEMALMSQVAEELGNLWQE